MSDNPVSEDLDQFFGAYFHQDWVFEADDWPGIVDSFVDGDRRPSAELLRQLAREIDCLRETRTEASLEHLLDKLGVYYDPRPLTFTAWLGQIADRLRSHADGIATE
ncbi:contact-dependent growth inhibition system immunity protein [[Mycobacterium] wendilense]|uniref:Contact-dependent growth inhibition system immunity protein n=1 Tax=[Mycobacterium] wendilense TaxID=3064284 RepID=A0ABN9NTL9_9MYCO|nr:contact-dependent growth inhibition system immunity protein [Mycolicibacterium sp. MU0050]CAJ1579257.1 contact-dependent growth inhibition system immunity protein [Mycolicibacterium sp. MU0050]